MAMNIRASVVKEALEAISGMKKQINENASTVLSKLLSEANLVDISSQNSQDTEKGEKEVKDTKPANEGGQQEPNEGGSKDGKTPEPKEDGNDSGETKPDNTSWDELENLKNADGKYDLRNASDDTIINVFKKMTPEDKLTIVRDSDGKITLKDEETEAEYIIDLGSDDNSAEPNHSKKNTTNNMDEQVIFEVALNCATNDYQKQTAMTTLPNTEVAPNEHRSVDAGVPQGSDRPYGKPDTKAAPFENPVNEEVQATSGDTTSGETKVEEAAQTVSTQPQGKETKTAMHREGHRDVTKVASKDGEYKGNLNTNEEKTYTVTESQMKRIDDIFNENKALKESLKKFRNELTEAVATNVSTNLALKVIIENTTTDAEKKDIAKRFMSECKTTEQAKALYESISRELKKTPSKQLTEAIQVQVETEADTKKLNEARETQVRLDESLSKMKDLIHRIC